MIDLFVTIYCKGQLINQFQRIFVIKCHKYAATDFFFVINSNLLLRIVLFIYLKFTRCEYSFIILAYR